MISAGQFFPLIETGSVFYRKTIPYRAKLDNIIMYVGEMGFPEANITISIQAGDNGKTIVHRETVEKGSNSFDPIKVDAGSIITVMFDYNEHVFPEDVEVSFLINRL